MGVDLTLIECNIYGNECFAGSILDLERSTLLWAAIRDLPSEEILLPISLFRRRDGDTDSYDVATLDLYGKALRYVHASDLAGLSSHEGVASCQPRRMGVSGMPARRYDDRAILAVATVCGQTTACRTLPFGVS